MIRTIIVILLFSSIVASQNLTDFPLWGSSWIVAQGNNKKIFPTALPLMPDKLAIVEFRSDTSVVLSYANLNHRTYRCTAELLDDIRLQFKKNTIDVPYDSILKGKNINVAYRPFDDTLWTGDPDVINYITKYQTVSRLTGNTDSTFGPGDLNKLKNTPTFFRSKPIYYGIRFSTTQDDDRYSINSVDDNGESIFLENDGYFSEQSSQKNAMKDLARRF